VRDRTAEQEINERMKREIEERKRVEEALRNALEESRNREAEISALLQGSRAVLRFQEFDGSARSIFDSCKNLIGATSGYIALLSEKREENELLFLDSGGLPCTVDPSFPMPIRGLRAEAYRTGKTVYENEFQNSEWVGFMPEGHVRLDNVLFAPLVLAGKAVGLLGLSNKPDGFTQNDAHIASAFGELATIALLNSRMLENLESSEERFRAVTQTATDAIISIDIYGRVVLWNKAAEMMFGHSVDEAIGKYICFIIPERFRAAHRDGMSRFLTSNRSRIIGETIELTDLTKDGNEFPIELSLSKWKAKENIFFTGIIRDITQRKQTEEALRKSTHELGERVKALNCLYGISHLREQEGISLTEIIQGAADLLPKSWQYPDITCARIVVEEKEYITENFKDTRWKLSSDISVHGEIIGSVGVYYLQEKAKSDEGPFLKEERSLINAIAERLGRIIEAERAKEGLQRVHDELEKRVEERTAELSKSNALLKQEIAERKRAEEALRRSENELRILSRQLVEAHEEESKRIGQELHDGLAQTLSAIKVWVETAQTWMNQENSAQAAKSLEHVVPGCIPYLVENGFGHLLMG
jgi:PAS domain S-box-containing protein